MTEKFKVKILEEASNFIDEVEEKARDKIIYNINKAQHSNDPELFKKLSGEIWEFRTLFKKTYYRLFAFWDKLAKTETIVVATHGLIKKTDKTPQADLDKAERIRKQYLEQKYKT